MQPVVPAQRRSRSPFSSTNLGDILQTPPRSAPRLTSALDAAINRTWNDYPADAAVHATSDSIRLKFQHPGFEGEWEVLKVAPGVWLTFGDHISNDPKPRWSQERQLRSFSIYLRGGAVFGLPESPQNRYMFLEGQAVGLSTTLESMLCSTTLPGVRTRGVSVFFEDEEAMRHFGLDVDEANQWLQTGAAYSARHPCKVVTAAANPAAILAAQAICTTTFAGARRKLFLRAKTAELLCYLMANPTTQSTVDDPRAAAPRDDAMIAALAHEALSHPERSPNVLDVAERLRVPSSRLRAAFQNTYGISMREHMLATRMARARHMLRLTDTPLIEIAFACGYEHHSSFSTAYRLAFDETPAETRRLTM
jgi:AraC-like DNA-binding protein